MRKIIHITHNDGDAVGCDVLVRLMGHLYGYDVESHFCNVNAASEELNKVLDTFPVNDVNTENAISAVIISDISIDEETLRLQEEFSDIYNLRIFG